MRCCVEREESVQGGEEADTPCYSVRGPASLVIEVGEDPFGIMLGWRAHCQGYNNGKEADAVEVENWTKASSV